MKKEIIILASALSLFGCGGGSESAVAGVSEDAQSADFKINDNKLINYAPGYWIKYKGTVDNTNATLTRSFELSSLPISFNSENGDFTESFKMIDAITSNNQTFTRTSEVAQFDKNNPDHSSTLFVHNETNGNTFTCPLVDEASVCYSRIEIPSPLTAGYKDSYSGYQSIGQTYWGVTSYESKEWSASYSVEVKNKVNIATDLGVFEVYPVKLNNKLIANSNDYSDYTLDATLYIHPSIGIIKAILNEKDYEGTTVSTFTITDTNIAY